MSWKDNAKQAGAGSAGPKLDVAYKFTMKKNEAGEIGFELYVKDENGNGTNQMVAKPISGVLLGRCMKASAFDQSFGKNGNSYNTDYYFTNKKVVLYAPGTGGKVVEGDMEAVESYVGANVRGAKLKKAMVLFVATDKGLIEISTNLSLGIEQTNKIGEKWLENEVVMTPVLYTPADKEISNKTHEMLNGKARLAEKNPFVWVKLELGAVITPEMEVKLDLEKRSADFLAWKNHKVGYVADSRVITNEPAKAEPVSAPAAAIPAAEPAPKPVNDLPF